MHWNVPLDALHGSAMFVLFWTAGLVTVYIAGTMSSMPPDESEAVLHCRVLLCD